MRIERMQTNHITNPLGFDLGDSPTFSWTVTDACGIRPVRTTLTVTTPDWTIEKDVDEHESLATQISMNLKPRTRYSWHVSIEDDTMRIASENTRGNTFGRMCFHIM